MPTPLSFLRCILPTALLLAALVPPAPAGAAKRTQESSRGAVAAAATLPQAELVVEGSLPQGLVGNGKALVVVGPGRYGFHQGGTAMGQFRLLLDGKPVAPQTGLTRALFNPGAIVQEQQTGPLRLRWLHGSLPDHAYLVALDVTVAAPGRHHVEVEFAGRGEPQLSSPGRQSVALDATGHGELVWSTSGPPPQGTFDDLRTRLLEPYRQGLVLRTPDNWLNRAVAFNRYLLDLGFDGRFHVCELFRWRDVWSRDLGSGLVPGALASGRFQAARATLDYDLGRYGTHSPAGLKVSEDPSQGGSAEGTAWLARAVWMDWLQSGDRAFLERAATVLRPWASTWEERDADQRGLLVDTTEWMDHSRFFLFPDGARILYSNALMADLMRTMSAIEGALGRPAQAQRWAALHRRFAVGINATLWDDRLGAYANLELWGQKDERLSTDGNVLAVLAGVASPERARRALATVRARAWRAAGSVTITPPMSHVDAANDHNYKVWPWWNAVEARARFIHGDTAGAMHLLERAAATLEDDHDPGLIEELTSTEGMTEGGHAFLTAAGSFLDAVRAGLLGIDILEPGAARLRVQPRTPAHWRDWDAEVPLSGGGLHLRMHGGTLSVTVSDPRVKVIEVPAGTLVTGAMAAALPSDSASAATAGMAAALEPAPVPLAAAAPRPRRAALFVEPGLTDQVLAGLPAQRVDAQGLARLDARHTQALVIAGNALPTHTRDGLDVKAALRRYLDQGGALVFFGATMHDRGTMGEHGGVVDWFSPAGDGRWQARDPLHDRASDRPVRHGVVSWGPGGDFFNGWETALGAFGFRVEGSGAEFTGPLAGLPRAAVPVHEAFTDFAVRRPWLFQPLAFTQTQRRLLHPVLSERYPCAARLVNTQTGGEIILLPASLAQADDGLSMLQKLGIH